MSLHKIHLSTSIVATTTFLLNLLLVSSCKKLVEIDAPSYRLGSATMFTDSSTAVAALYGLYSQLYNGGGTGTSFYSQLITTAPARYADETVAVQNALDPFYTNTLTPGLTEVSNLWAHSYNVIYNANSIIEGAMASTALTASFKKQLIAEAKFFRAFCHFYLVNYFGDVPIITVTDLSKNRLMERKPVSEVYLQIVNDLKDVKNDLLVSYSASGTQRTRVNSYVASALLARVYLYTGNWPGAEAEATRVIDMKSLYEIDPNLDNVFLVGSKEAMLAFNVNVYGRTYLAGISTPPDGVTPVTALTTSLLNAFEAKDLRRTKWIASKVIGGTTYAYSNKYKIASGTGNNTEKEVAIRLAELYLVRAEARLRQDKYQDAQDDLNVIRLRANVDKFTSLDKTSLTIAIAHERQTELFHEWGHRFLDLKRTGTADAVLKPLKPGWTSEDLLFPIPQTARSTNISLTQNNGYN